MEDTLLGEKIQLEADLVVLATGMVPKAADGESIRLLEDAKGLIAKDEAGAHQVKNAGTALVTGLGLLGYEIPILVTSAMILQRR